MSNKYFYIFNDSINEDSVQKLINDLCDKSNVILYFTTEGGYTYINEVLIDFLNSRSDTIEIVFTNTVESCGTILLASFKGKISLSDELDTLLFHKVDRKLYGQRKSSFNSNELRKIDKELNIKLSDKFKELGLTEKEIKKFNRGEDVILYKKDFNRLKLQ